MFSLPLPRIFYWRNGRVSSDLKRHDAHVTPVVGRAKRKFGFCVGSNSRVYAVPCHIPWNYESPPFSYLSICFIQILLTRKLQTSYEFVDNMPDECPPQSIDAKVLLYITLMLLQHAYVSLHITCNYTTNACDMEAIKQRVGTDWLWYTLRWDQWSTLSHDLNECLLPP